MNKKIILLLALLILFCPVSVYAAKDSSESQVNEDLESGVKDEKGVFTSGTVIYQNEVSGKLYGHKYVVEGDGLYVETNKERTVVIVKTTGNAVITQYNSMPDSSNVWTPDTNKIYLSKDMPCAVRPIVNLTSSLPVFNYDDENYQENLKKYLESGDVSGAENVYDISQPDQDNSVELPSNLRTYGKYGYKQDNAMTVRWDVPSDVNNYTYDVRIKVDYSTKDKDGSTDWYNAVTDYPYERNDQYDLNTGKPISRNTSTPEDFKVNRDVVSNMNFNGDGSYVNTIRSIHVEVRNRLGNKCSNWVSVEAQVDGDNSTTVKDNNGNVVQDDIYNGQNTNNSDHSTQYDTDPDFSKEDPNFSLSDFYNYLKSGFGLLGSNGLFAFFSRSFSFVPSDIWNLILAGVAAMIIVGIVNFALKR